MKIVLIYYIAFSLIAIIGNIFTAFRMYEVYKNEKGQDKEGVEILKVSKELECLINTSLVCLIPLYHLIVIIESIKILGSNSYSLHFAEDYIKSIRPIFKEYKKDIGED